MNSLVEEAKDLLQTQGGRMTEQRRIIFETLESLDTHPSAEELHGIVQQQNPEIHLSTVYRTLRWLEKEGLISSRWFEEERRQERFDPALPSEHYHFVCSNCKKVIEFDSTQIDAMVVKFEMDFGAQIEGISLVLHGLCAVCKKYNR